MLGDKLTDAFTLVATGGNEDRGAVKERAGLMAAQMLLNAVKHGKTGEDFAEACPPPGVLAVSCMLKLLSGNEELMQLLKSEGVCLDPKEIRSNCNDHSVVGSTGSLHGGPSADLFQTIDASM